MVGSADHEHNVWVVLLSPSARHVTGYPSLSQTVVDALNLVVCCLLVEVGIKDRRNVVAFEVDSVIVHLFAIGSVVEVS